MDFSDTFRTIDSLLLFGIIATWITACIMAIRANNAWRVFIASTFIWLLLDAVETRLRIKLKDQDIRELKAAVEKSR